ncbi:glycosyltransferase family 2 protein [Haloterrigena alkaliphila]|uniref:Glycosyltransferase family 2 protein n=1 Tax=Haloterrigena alkaliphila TaxID=2816475 RepID=A0A8A2VD99_9EURY|nr:glycosyltransferase family 2 protein [Haloterrigena alkaliphila]QSX00034.1 glycosyltransferase family 2 protein [Haloterrigena alkaliphila]
MYDEHTIGVVIPAYNEEGLVGDVVRDVPTYVDRIYAIDDRSTDGTRAEITDAAERDATNWSTEDGFGGGSSRYRLDGSATLSRSGAGQTRFDAQFENRVETVEQIGRVVSIRHAENRGAGGAIKTGYLAALVDDIDVVATIDGDGQMDPTYLDRFLDPIVDGPAEYTKGSRFMNTSYREEMPPFRAFGNVLLTLLTKVASGYWRMTDPQNGYTAISNRALREIDVGDLFEYYGYCNSVLVRLNASDLPIADVDIPALYGDEDSNIEYATYVRKVSLMLLENFLWRLKTKQVDRGFYPTSVLYVVGAASIAFGALRAIQTRILSDDRSVSSAMRSAVVFATVGLLSVLSAILSEWFESRSLESKIEFE